MQARAHCVALGLVQGVGYRWFVARRAQALGLSGFVRNLYDGSVELEVEGEKSLVEELVKEIRIGPRSARVTNIVIEWVEPLNQQGGFNIR